MSDEFVHGLLWMFAILCMLVFFGEAFSGPKDPEQAEREKWAKWEAEQDELDYKALHGDD